MADRHRPLWLELLLLIAAPIIALALGVAATMLLGISQSDYANLVVNLFLLLAGLGLIRLFGLTSQALGLKLLRAKLGWHLLVSLAILAFYLVIYLFVIRISGLKPLSSSIRWGLLTNVVVVVAEELYFRGVLYGFMENRFSPRAALVVSSLMFGLIHARQGLGGMISKLFTGWLWGSVRYSSGMIFLLIFPIHYTYNTIWLLFEGNWDSPPAWATVAVPAVELLLGLAIVLIADRRQEEA